MKGLIPVHAQTKDSATTKVERAPVPALDPNAEYVTPVMSMGGPVVTNILLANRIACDRLQVNGYDLLQLNDAILKLLERQHVASTADLQAVVQAGKVEHPLRSKPQ
jgi:hypothetical protein